MNTNAKKYRIGIDVGGTFTHAVAIETPSLRLVGKIKVPTTHQSASGVGAGVVDSLAQLMKLCGIQSSDILVVAHSTTQATNSLLEGDVEKVAIVSVGSGVRGWLTARSTRLGDIELSPGRFLRTSHFHVDLSDPNPSASLDGFLEKLKREQIRVVVVAGAFSIEDPHNEREISNYIRAKGFLCTPSSEISQLFGLRIRVRTAAINLSILPKMLDVAEHVETEIRKLGVKAPLMIMRSDGGVMSIEEMRKKPILTLLSGPAAGIAAALRYLSISDGIFLEVGGTSTDISAIKNGRAMVRPATIGGNRTFLETLDCRTVGIGGGSMPRVHGSKVVDVGPRSAHIAGVHYAAFEDVEIKTYKAETVSPREGDPSDYLVLKSQSGTQASLTFTPTCAANALGLVPQGDCAQARASFASAVDAQFEALGLGGIKEFSQNVLEEASKKVTGVVEDLLREYKLSRELVTLVGGGGGAAAIVPFVANKLGMKFEIARDNDVISAIGAALGLIRVVVERSCLSPSQEDIFKLRQDAREQILRQGASPDHIEVFIEVDEKRNIIRAEAQGAMEYSAASQKSELLSEQELRRHAEQVLPRGRPFDLVKKAASNALVAFEFLPSQTGFLSRLRHRESVCLVLDTRGVVRLRLSEAHCYETRVEALIMDFHRTVEPHVQYGDGGVTYPFVFVLVADRIIDLSKLNSSSNIVHVLELEIKEVPSSERAVLVYAQNVTE